MGVTIVLPTRAKKDLSTGSGTKIYIDGKEIKEVTSFSIPECGVDTILEATITLPLERICYADEYEMTAEQIRDEMEKLRKK